ncbi:uncharacterized protein LOC121728334 [Aricia agestis]|uniref:uncharacterized protein LOC121728334 n=1 Tax=Aricia agestis TaxID=91739 RepID=UPI001C20231C|nr:uncharacterized protein LOC121728334 [Aricia agestis]
MEYSLVLLVFTVVLKICTGIKCYKCSPDEGSSGPPCKHFDKHDEVYLVDCEHSTMCHKRVTSLDVNNENHLSIHRGCASQTIPGDQSKINGKWQVVNTIYEVYTEGCSDDNFDPDRPSKIVNCYCRGDKCNNSHRHKSLPFVYLVSLYTLWHWVSQ